MLLNVKNVVLPPHFGNASQYTRDKMAMMAAQNIIDYFDGNRPSHLANTEIYERIITRSILNRSVALSA